MFSHDALWYQILQGPIAILGGLGFGVLWGWLAKYVPEKGDVSTLNFTRFYYIDDTTRLMISGIIFNVYRIFEIAIRALYRLFSKYTFATNNTVTW